MWVLFEWRTGQILRTLQPSGEDSSDKIILSADGMDSATLNIPLESLSQADRNSWQTVFVGIKHGIAYYEEAADGPVVIYAGQLKQRSIVDGKLRLQATSMLEYLEHYAFVDPSITRITNPDQLAEFKNVTAKQYVSQLLSVVNTDPLAPSISIGSGDGPSNTFTTSRRVRDLPSVGEMIRELMEDPAGTEVRFHAHKSGDTITWTVRFPSTGRLYPGRWGNASYNLSDPNVTIVDLSPSSSYDDYFNTLWHEIPVERPEDAEDWDPVIDLRKSENIPDGFPRYTNSISLGEVSDTERNFQINARLSDSIKALDNWEVRVWSELFENGAVKHPVAWTDSASGALGRRVAISGGEEYDAAGLNGTYRCIGLELSSNSSSVRLQLSNERISYRRMPRTIIEKAEEKDRDRFPHTTINPWQRPNPNDPAVSPTPGDGGGGPGDDTGLPEFEMPNEGWEWGSENYPFKSEMLMSEPIYGFDILEAKWSDAFVLGENVSDDPNSQYWVWAQDDTGLGVYSAFFEGFDEINQRSEVSTSNSNYRDLERGISFKHALDATDDISYSTIRPVSSENAGRLVISSGMLKDGTLQNFSRRAEIPLDSELVRKLLFSNKAYMGFNDGLVNARANSFVVIHLGAIHAYKDKILVRLTATTVSGDSQANPLLSHPILHRILSVKKGEKYDSVDQDMTSLSASYRATYFDSNLGTIRYSETGTSIRAGSWMLDLSINQDDVKDFSPENELDWGLAAGNVPVTAFVTESSQIAYPAISIGTEEEALAFPSDVVGAGPGGSYPQRPYFNNQFTCIARDSLNMSAYSYVSASNRSTFVKLAMFGNGMFSSPFSRWENIVKYHDDTFRELSAYSTPITHWRPAFLTIKGCPLAVELLTTSSAGACLRLSYLNRLYDLDYNGSKNLFDPRNYGLGGGGSNLREAGLPSGASAYSSSLASNFGLVPLLSYNNNAGTMPENGGRWDYYSQAGARGDSFPFFAYHDGWVYALPTNKSPRALGVDSNGNPNLRKIIAFRIEERLDPYDFPKGDQAINAPRLTILEPEEEE